MPRDPRPGYPRHSRLALLGLLCIVLVVLGARAIIGQPAILFEPGPLDVRLLAASKAEFRVIVSLGRRHLWVVNDSGDTLRSARVAVGSGRTLRAQGRRWHFVTPRGIRTVISKEMDPVWVKPDWAYFETARTRHLRVESVTPHHARPLQGGRMLVARGDTVGVQLGAAFEPLPAGEDIVFGHTLYIPPETSISRRVPKTLGKYRLNLGDSIGLHGTLDSLSIGRAVTHGCMRLGDADLEWVYLNVPVGTHVYIY